MQVHANAHKTSQQRANFSLPKLPNSFATRCNDCLAVPIFVRRVGSFVLPTKPGTEAKYGRASESKHYEF